MIVYLYGPDSYRRGEKLKDLLCSYKQKNPSMDLRHFDFEEEGDGWIEARDFLEQPSMFQSVKCAVIREATTPDSKEWIAVLKFYIENKNAFIIISDLKPPKKAFSFLLKKPILSQEFEKLEGVKLQAFLKKKAKDFGISFSQPAWSFFMVYVLEGGEFLSKKISSEHSVWLGIKTLEKLAPISGEKEISLSLVKETTHWFSRDEVYVLTRGILSSKSWKERVGMLEKAFSQNEDPAYVFNSLAYNAREESLVSLSRYDVSVKSGGLEYEEALLDFVLR